MAGTWRNVASPIITRVLKETQGQDEKTIRKALHDAYPFGMRQYHPYKVWLDEIAKQRGKKKVDRYGRAKKPIIVNPDQGVLL
jgi:hypothetical protein